MKWLNRITRFSLLTLCLVLPIQAARACPACQDAISASGSTDDDANNLPAAMNQSIFIMVGVPYLALGGITFFVYRGVKKNREYFERLGVSKDEAADKIQTTVEN